MFKIQMYYPTDTLICIFGIRTRVLLIIFKLDLFFFFQVYLESSLSRRIFRKRIVQVVIAFCCPKIFNRFRFRGPEPLWTPECEPHTDGMMEMLDIFPPSTKTKETCCPIVFQYDQQVHSQETSFSSNFVQQFQHLCVGVDRALE